MTDDAPVTTDSGAARTDPRIRDRADELVVALSHVAPVARMLHSMGIDARETERDGLLDLALVSLAPAADRPGDPWDSGRDGRLQHTVPEVLQRLRERFAADHGNWQPTVGRNRVLDHVAGAGGVVSFGGERKPAGGTVTPAGGVVSFGAEKKPAGGVVSFGGEGSPTAPSPDVDPTPRAAGPGAGVRIGVLDTALSAHPWLAGGWAARYSDILRPPTDAELSEIAGHGTFVTGLVLGQAPGALVELRRVLGDDGTRDSWSVARAIAAAGQAGLDVLNLSFVCFTEDGQPPLALATAVDRVPTSTVVVAAAGNQGDPRSGLADRPAWPAALDDVIAAGAATGSGGTRASFSPDQPWVDVLAPGVDVVSTYLQGKVQTAKNGVTQFGGFARWSGTSFAAALVTGAIAAGVQPGRVTARQSWLDIRSTLGGTGAGGPAGAPSLPLQLLWA